MREEISLRKKREGEMVLTYRKDVVMKMFLSYVYKKFGSLLFGEKSGILMRIILIVVMIISSSFYR